MTEEARRHHAARLVDQDDDALLVVETDIEGRASIVFAGGAVERLLAVPSARLEGQPLGVLRSVGADPLDLARLLRAVAGRLRTAFHLALNDANGPDRLHLLGRPLAGGPGYLVRLQAEADQHTSIDERPPSTLEITDELVYRLRVATNLALTLDWVGGAFTRLTGYRQEDVLALGGFEALIEPSDLKLVQRRAQRLFRGEPATAEYRIRTRQGQRLWLRDRARPVIDEAEDLVVAIVGAAQDVSRQRILETRVVA
ncbi:MAG: PAS domain-containing protein, partial [Geminicoccaceae bacterium]|nr:PAS domain-containing protein [Geminicoccaceae bacterium]